MPSQLTKPQIDRTSNSLRLGVWLEGSLHWSAWVVGIIGPGKGQRRSIAFFPTEKAAQADLARRRAAAQEQP